MTLNGAIKQLHELRSAEDMPIYYKPAIAEVINVLLMDTQEVEHGHWVAMNDDGRGYADEFGCTNCSCVVKCGYFTKGCDYEWCPWCGAKMDEEDTDERTD